MSGKTIAVAHEKYETTEFSCVPIGGVFTANSFLVNDFIIESEVWVKTAKKTAFCFDTNKGVQFKPEHPVETYSEISIIRTYED